MDTKKNNYDDLPDIAIEYLNYMLTIKGKSPRTLHEYHYDLRTFFRYLKLSKNKINSNTPFDEIKVMDLTLDDIKQIDITDLYSYMAYASRELKNNSVTRARKVASVKSFYKYLHTKLKIIDANPAAELESPKVVKRLPKYLNVDESLSLLNSVEGKNATRDYAILVLFLNCGMRLSELVGINLNNIKGDVLTVIGKGNKERTVYLNDACIAALDAYRQIRPIEGVKDKKALFLSERKQRISPKTVQYLVKKYIGSAGLDPDKYSTHKLRHTAATLMYKHGRVDIRALQSILGHESIATTEIYTHVDNDQLRKAVQSNPLSSVTFNQKERSKRKGEKTEVSVEEETDD